MCIKVTVHVYIQIQALYSFYSQNPTDKLLHSPSIPVPVILKSKIPVKQVKFSKPYESIFVILFNISIKTGSVDRLSSEMSWKISA